MTNYRNNPWRRSDGGMGDLLGAALAIALIVGCLAYYGLWLAAGVVVVIAILVCNLR